MAQIAQQDRFVIEEASTIAAMSAGGKKELHRAILSHFILDVIVKTVEAGKKVNYSKVIGYEVDSAVKEHPVEKVYLLNTNTGAVATVTINN